MRPRTVSFVRPNLGDYRSTDALPPLAFGILAARTPPWVKLRFFDEKVEELPADDRPDLAALTVETFTARRAYAIADRYRARGVPVVLGGYHPTFLPEEALEHAEAVVEGDAEGVWERLLEDFSMGRLQRRYKGDSARSLADVRVDRSIFRDKYYPPIVPVQYGRGCRFSCDFCSIHAFYETSRRQRPLERLSEELSSLNRRRLVFFVDDNLFTTPADFSAFLNHIRPFRLRWSCQISVDIAKESRLLDAMAEAGCVSALIGFESLIPENLRQMKKGWNRHFGTFGEVVRAFHRRGIAVNGAFVFGYDGETVDSIRRTVEFAVESRMEVANFNILTPTPGSDLYGRLRRENRLLLPTWWTDPRYRFGDPVFVPRRITPERLSEECFNAKKRFYSWGSIAGRLWRSEAGLDWFRTGTMAFANFVSRREILKKHRMALGG